MILDEIHAVAQTKRGAHLAITLERLVEQAGRDVQRVGLSATQNPLEEVGRFMVGPKRRVHGRRHRRAQAAGPEDPRAGGVDGRAGDRWTWSSTRSRARRRRASRSGRRCTRSCSSSSSEHRSTLIFVNNRRAAERLALRLNELAEEPIARAHHGSLAREERLVVEEQLKAGELPCLVATSSLELGIDMGAVDLVLQVESPKSVTAGLQRIGRAGHNVGDTSKGRIFPKFRADLLECAVVAQRMREGKIETTVVPRNPLDVLAQQIVAMAASSEDEPLSVDAAGGAARPHLHVRRAVARRSSRTCSTCSTAATRARSSASCGRGSSGTAWPGRSARARASRALAITNAGTIPDRGLYSVNLPDGRRVGELDEEMVYEARAGPGVPARRLLVADRGDHARPRDRHARARASRARSRSGRATGSAARRSSARRSAPSPAGRSTRTPETLADELRPRPEGGRRTCVEFLREQQEATRVIPSRPHDRDRALPRRDRRLAGVRPVARSAAACTPPGGSRCRARIREEYGLESDAIWSDDGIIVHLPDADERAGRGADADRAGRARGPRGRRAGRLRAVRRALPRERRPRAADPARLPGRRTPLWQQRLKSQSLLEVARRYAQFPIVLETYREVLRDVLDLPGLHDLLTKLHRRELSLVEVETPTASPFASSLLFDYVATYMYEGDQPNAERRAAALALDRELLRELLGQEELRELIDPGALETVEADLQRLSERTRADSVDALHDVLRRVGDLTLDEAQAARRHAGLAGAAASGERRAIEPARRRRAALGRGRGRRALPRRARRRPAVRPAGGVHRRRAGRDGAARQAATPAPTARSRRRALRERYGARPDARAGAAGAVRRARARRAAPRRHDARVVRPRGAAPAAPRLAGRAARGDRARRPARVRPLPGLLAGHRPPPAGRRGHRPAARDARAAAGPGAAAGGVGARRAAAPHRRLLARAGWTSCARRARSCGSARGRSAAARAAWRCTSATTRRCIGPPPNGRRAAVASPCTSRSASACGPAPCFFTDLLTDVAGFPTEELQNALWDLVWAGEATNDAFAPLRSPEAHGRRRRGRSARARSAGARSARAAAAARQPAVQGRWSLDRPRCSARDDDPAARRRTQAELLLERYGIVTREQVLAEGIPGGFSSLYDSLAALETIGIARRGYFVEGLGGAQFALPGAVERLRAQRDDDAAPPIVLAATDPAQPYGARPEVAGHAAPARPRQAGAYVVLAGAEPVLFVERGGKGLQVLVDADDPRIEPSLAALVEAVKRGRIKRLALEKVDGEPVVGSAYEEPLLELGFRAGPRKLTLTT